MIIICNLFLSIRKKVEASTAEKKEENSDDDIDFFASDEDEEPKPKPKMVAPKPRAAPANTPKNKKPAEVLCSALKLTCLIIFVRTAVFHFTKSSRILLRDYFYYLFEYFLSRIQFT